MGNIEDLKNVDLQTINPSELVDINTIHIDIKKDKPDRLKDFIQQIHNPYCFKCGAATVKVSFTNSGETLQDRLLLYLEQSNHF